MGHRQMRGSGNRRQLRGHYDKYVIALQMLSRRLTWKYRVTILTGIYDWLVYILLLTCNTGLGLSQIRLQEACESRQNQDQLQKSLC